MSTRAESHKYFMKTGQHHPETVKRLTKKYKEDKIRREARGDYQLQWIPADDVRESDEESEEEKKEDKKEEEKKEEKKEDAK